MSVAAIDRVYLRHSTDKQTDQRQRHALRRLIEGGAPVYDDPATTSRIVSTERPGFSRLLQEAGIGDTVRIADAARLFRSVGDVLVLRPLLIRRGLHLRVESGLLSGIDLAADDPGTKMVVSVLAAVLEFQRDMISENTREGVAAATASGKTLGRPWTIPASAAQEVVAAYTKGAAVKALAREYETSPRTIRRVLDLAGARALPNPAALDAASSDEEASTAPAPEDADPVVSVDLPGLVAEQLLRDGDQAVREALDKGHVVRRGQGYLVRVTAPLSLHTAMAEQSAAALTQTPAGRKAHRIHQGRLTAASPEGTSA